MKSLVFVMLVTILPGKDVRGNSTAVDCGQLTDSDIMTLRARAMTELHWSFGLIPPLRSSMEASHPLFNMDTDSSRRYTFLYGESGRHCPRKDYFDIHDTCPVHYVMQHDPLRVPKNIAHARCNCKKCRHTHSSPFTKCQESYTYTPVMRRNTSNCEYSPALEPVPVSCRCVSTLTIEQV